MTDDPEEYLKPAELSAWIKVTESALATWRSNGDGPPYVKLGTASNAAVRYRRGDVAAWLSASGQA